MVEETLSQTIERASEGLFSDKMQLLLTTSLQSNLLDMFDAYMLSVFNEMNEGCKLDVFVDSRRHPEP